MSTSGTNPASIGWRGEAASSNRRLDARQRVHIPAYASFAEDSSRMVLDLSEVLDISEQGMSIQTSPPLIPNRSVNLFLDLVATKAFIPAAGRVVWSDESGRSGIHFPQMHEECRRHLRQWLVANAIAAAPAEPEALPNLREPVPPAPSDYSSVLMALAAVKREVEALKGDPDAALQLIAARAQTFTDAAGSAIALAEVPGAQEMICRARTGSSAPPLGARLRAGDGFSGKCVRAGTLLCCEDSDSDPRVDRESCRALDIRSMVAAPIQAGGDILGIIEVFSPQPQAFNSNDNVILERLAQIVAAVASPPPFLPHRDPVNGSQPPAQETVASGAFTQAESLLQTSTALDTPVQPRESELSDHALTVPEPAPRPVLLVVAATTLIVALLWLTVPFWRSIAGRAPRNGNPRQTMPQPVQHPPASNAPVTSSPEDFAALRQLAETGEAAAQFAVGARYANGEGVSQDFPEAFRWFSKAAEQGHVVAQATLGAYYWAGRGVPQDLSKAYFWGLIAAAGGDAGSSYRVAALASRLSHEQVIAEQQHANEWIKSHQLSISTPTVSH